MQTADFHFDLPADLIAQTPAPRRQDSRLMLLHRESGQTEHRLFPDFLEYISAGDVVVLNNSRVIPARLRAVNPVTGGKFEMLLLTENAPNDWWCLMYPGARARVGLEIQLQESGGGLSAIHAVVLEKNSKGHRRISFKGLPDIGQVLDRFGEVPLPPYIHRAQGPTEQDRERYQTVFAEPAGSVAAPTAGLHFTTELLDAIRSRGALVCSITLHVGPGTFAPVKAETLEAHTMHEECYELPGETADMVETARQSGKRIFAVGTTAVRVLESVAGLHGGRLAPGKGRTNIFIHPPFSFQIVDALLTNFHLSRSTLLMLVSAFAAPGTTRGRDLVLSAYAEAIRERYRFFSYGDAMLVL